MSFLPSFRLGSKSKAKDQRTQAASDLAAAKITSCLWMEDALHRYGVPTLRYSFWLLVFDVQAATSALEEKGWSQTEFPSYDVECKLPLKRTAQALVKDLRSERIPVTILLPASHWGYDLSTTVEQHVSYPVVPKLQQLLNGLISMYFSLEWRCEGNMDLRGHLAVLIGYPYLYLQDVRKHGFEEKGLLKQYWQLHYDMLEEGNQHAMLNSNVTWEYQKKNSQRIANGELEPKRPLKIKPPDPY